MKRGGFGNRSWNSHDRLRRERLLEQRETSVEHAEVDDRNLYSTDRCGASTARERADRRSR